MKKDRVLFILPSSLEGLIAAMSAIQSFVECIKENVKLGIGVKDVEITYWACYLDSFIDVLKGHFPDGKWLIFGDSVAIYNNPIRGEFDLVHRFDVESAYYLSRTTGMHLTQVFSMQIGSKGESFPKLPIDPLGDGYLLVIRDNDTDFNWEATDLPDEEIRSVTMLYSRHVLPIHIQQASLVIGIRSGLTYYASIIGKAVYELYPSDRHRNWLSKWKNPLYRMHYGYENNKLHNDLMTDRVKQLWAAFNTFRQASGQGSAMRTELSTSTVVPAVS